MTTEYICRRVFMQSTIGTWLHVESMFRRSSICSIRSRGSAYLAFGFTGTISGRIQCGSDCGSLSGLSDKATRFQKWPEDGNISGYAHFLSSRENRRFYTKCSFIFWILLFFVEKYKAFFVISREAKKQMIFYVEMTSCSIVPHLT